LFNVTHFPQRKPVAVVQATVAHGDVGFIQKQPQPQLPMHSSPVCNNDHGSVISESLDEQQIQLQSNVQQLKMLQLACSIVPLMALMLPKGVILR
jgi:hypothetical protein